MTREHEPQADSILSEITRETEALRQAILTSDTEAIESHSRRASSLLEELRPILTGEKLPVSAAVLELRDAVQGCAAVIQHVHRSVRALLSLHHSASDPRCETEVRF